MGARGREGSEVGCMCMQSRYTHRIALYDILTVRVSMPSQTNCSRKLRLLSSPNRLPQNHHLPPQTMPGGAAMLALLMPNELQPFALLIFSFTSVDRCDVCDERPGLCVRVSSGFAWMCLTCSIMCLESTQPVWMHGSADARVRAVVTSSSSLEVEDSDDMVRATDSDDM
jgi:hypothetical protein